MTLSPQEKQRLRERVADHLVEMEPLFDSRCKLTFIMRAPFIGDGDLLVTNDGDLDAVMVALKRLAGYEKV